MNLKEVITDSQIFEQFYILRDGYEFKPLTYPLDVYDAIVIRSPINIQCNYRIPKIEHSLSEHIELINQMKIEKTIIFNEDISFITQCPTLQYLEVIPSDSAGNNFDFSPLYEMPQIKSLVCMTELLEKFSGTIDYNKIKGLEKIRISGEGHLNYNCIDTLKTLRISDYKYDDLTKMFCSTVLDTLSIIQCKIKSLDGIEMSSKMQCLYLDYNRSLKDISALKHVKNTLKALHIENCPQISDFSVLGELENLELLELFGSNTLPNLDFISNMKNLKTFSFSVNVENGDLSPCLNLRYSYSQRTRKHYNLKDKDLPKIERIKGNENIELWRCLE